MLHRIAAVLAITALGLAANRVTAQAPAATQATQPEIRKKLIEATKELAESLKALATAESAEVDAKAEVEKARAKAEALRAEVAKLNRQLLDAAQAQALVVRGGPRGGTATQERENADPLDPYERFALLTPGGPVIVQVAITVGGQPFRTLREKVIDDMLAGADKDKDGQAKWEEAAASPRFAFGRAQLGLGQRETMIRALDANRDGLVDRSEARMFVAQYFGAPTFSLGGYGTAYGGFAGNVVVVNGQMVATGGGQADLRALLDLDADGVLSDKEIAAVTERLKSRDADDNDLLYPQEISGNAVASGRVAAVSQRGRPGAQTSILLGPVATADSVFAALSQQYKNDNGDIVPASFAAVPGLFVELDQNEDGKLQQAEVLALNDVQPHIELAADIGAADAKGVTLKSVAEGLAKVSESADNAVLELPGTRLSLFASRAAPQTINYEQQASAYLSRFDADKNGYLEKSELPENVYQSIVAWDENEDGKIFAEEMTASLARQAAPLTSQVVANVASQGNSLFQTLDQTGDGRLSLREMRLASQQISALDKDGDKQISLDEIPNTINVTFTLGNAGYRYQAIARPGATPAAQPAAARAGPEWFQRMDRNGDGDVTLKEFLGDEAEFKQLDTNADGFIEAKEAAAVEMAK
jgi:hypothetical protein